MIESGVTFDYAQLVGDDEIARMVKQVVGEINHDGGHPHVLMAHALTVMAVRARCP
jgi:hypothetical protein